MTEKPPATALDRLRAGLGLRQEAPPPADPDGPAPQASPDPPEPAAPPPAEDPAPIHASTGKTDPPPQTREAPPSAGSEQPRTAAEPAPQSMNTARLRALQETVERQQVRHRKELSGTRLRINLTWAVAVMLGTAIMATAAYFSLSHMQEDLFQRHWPWRAHVWNKYGGDVLWCINEARKTSEPLVCQITFGIRGPDCYRVEMEGDRFMIRCPSWERWPTDPAPHWGPDGPPPWSR